MKTEPITTETAKVQLLPILKYSKKKGALATLSINTTIAIPATRTIDVLVDKKLVPGENELIAIMPKVSTGCMVHPSLISPDDVPKELKLIFVNVSNQTVRLEANKPVALVQVLTVVQGKAAKKDE
jgi:hypothetical protein